jgi:hypothetical protein
MIASALQVAADIQPGPDRDALVHRCRAQATRVLGGGIAAESWLDPIGAGSPTSALRAFVQQLNVRNHLQLGAHIVESLFIMSEPGSIEHGRLLMQLASQAGLAGEDDLLSARGKVLFALARDLRSDELLLDAWIQQNAFRYSRGNFPAWGMAVRRCVKYAERLGDPRLMALALNMRMTVMGEQGDLGGAIAEGWRGVEMCDHPELRQRLLVNIGEALKRSGHYRAARAAGASLLESPLERGVLLSVLGAYAESCAGLGDRAGVGWATQHALARTTDPKRGARGPAQGLMGCADACAKVGLDALAREAFARSMAIAEAKGYHDLRFHTAPKVQTATRDAALPFSGSAEQARRSIVDLAPDGVPLTLDLVER